VLLGGEVWEENADGLHPLVQVVVGAVLNYNNRNLTRSPPPPKGRGLSANSFGRIEIPCNFGGDNFYTDPYKISYSNITLHYPFIHSPRQLCDSRK